MNGLIRWDKKRVILAVPVLMASLITMAIPSPALSHDGHTHKAPWEVCEAKKLADQCSYKNGAGDLFIGSCQAFVEQLMCIRNQPIVKFKAAEKEQTPALKLKPAEKSAPKDTIEALPEIKTGDE